MAQVNRAYLSSINFLDRRDILNEVLDLYEEEKTIMDMMEMTGRAKVAEQMDYHNFVNDWLYKPATVASATAVASLVTDGDGYSTGTITITSAADAPIIGELGMQPLTGSIFLVTDVSGTAVSVKSLNKVADGDKAYTADWTANDIVTFFSNAHGEGSGANLMRNSTLIKEMNYLQSIKTKYRITDFARGSKIEVNFGGKPYYFLKQQHDAFRKHQMDMMFAFLLNKRGLTKDKDGNDVYTTDGLDHYITDRGGIQHTVTVPGVIDKDEFRSLTRAMDRARTPREYWSWEGGEVYTIMDDFIGGLTELVNGGITYNSFGKGDGKKRAIELGVKSLGLYGYTFHRKKFEILDHPKVTWVDDNTGDNASKYPGYIYLLPTTKIKVANGTDRRGEVDRFCTRYLEYENSENTRFKELHLEGLAPRATSDKSVYDIVYMSIQGLMCVGVQHFARLDLNDVSNYN